jgi:hypothetical protein
MLSILTLGAGVFTAQKRNIKSPSSMTDKELWHKADSLAEKSLPLQAQPLLDELKHRAYQSKNSAEAVKVMMYNFRLNERRTEDALKTYIGKLEKETTSMWEPYRQIAHSMLGEMYRAYYNNNRYRLLNAEGTKEEASGAWSHQYVISKIHNHYRASLKNSALLQKSDIKSVKTILTNSKMPANLRPTLYDFLANRAIDALINSEYDILKPEEQFEVNQPSLWLPAAEFVKTGFNASNDTLNPQREALAIYRQLLQFRLADTHNGAALTDAERNRFAALYNIYSGTDGDSLYWQALNTLAERNTDPYMAAELMIEKAGFIINTQQTAVKGEGKNHPAVKALAIIDQCIKKYPKSNAACKATNMRINILRKELNTETETVVLPGKPIPVKIDYRNITTAHLHIFKVTVEQFNKFDNRNDSVINLLSSQKAVSSTRIALPDFYDHQSHSAHYEAKPLTDGQYIAVLSSTPEIDTKNNNVSITAFQVSSLGGQTIRENNNLKLRTFDRLTGAIVPGAEVEITFTTGRKEIKRTATTDSNGETVFNIDLNHRGYRYSIKKDGMLLLSGHHWDYQNRETPVESSKTMFFTDREIYRPGQTIYFKAITIQGIKEKWNVCGNEPVTVVLRDANGKEHHKLNLRTNDFGSVWGSFTIPKSTINGSWSISNDKGTRHFRVEEYKRPRFEVDFEPVTRVVATGDTITVEGKASAYAGNTVAGAKITYSVKYSENIFMRWWRVKEHQIAHGETTTGKDGKFAISFVANPVGEKRNNDQNPQFSITATVTDPSGESHDISTRIMTTKGGVQLRVENDNFYYANQPVNIICRAENSNGNLVTWNGELKVTKQKRTAIFLPEAYWNKPDTIISPNSNYRFNGESYWEDDATIFTSSVTTSETSKTDINQSGQIKAGYYKAEFSGKDKNGDPINSTSYFTVIDGSKNESHYDSSTEFLTVKESSENEVTLIAASLLTNAKGLITCTFDDGSFSHIPVELNGTQKAISFSIPNNKIERGYANLLIISNNRQYTSSTSFVIPHPERQLTPKLKTWRDKTTPGSSEEWTIEVTRDGRPAANCEIVATLYDSSLDQLAANNWYMNGFNHWFTPSSWRSSSFGSQHGIQYDRNSYSYKSYDDEGHHNLNWFGYYMNSSRPVMLRGASTLKKQAVGEVFYIMNDAVNVEEESEIPMTNQAEMAPEPPTPQQHQIRSDFSETAFFYPDLKTDENGKSEIKFTLPHNVTTYKFMGMAHTRDGAWGKTTEKLTVQKELMVMPNMPAFLREGDIISITSNLVSLSEEELSGKCAIKISDTNTGKPLSITEGASETSFILTPKSNDAISWTVRVPSGMEALKIAITASAGEHNDGEEYIVPVLPRKVPVYESHSFVLYEPGSHKASFTGFKPHQGTQMLEFGYTTATAAEVLKALPLMMDSNHEASEQIFSRYFGYAVGQRLTRETDIMALLQEWKAQSENGELLSPLVKDEHLKSITINETPWLSAANNETAARMRLTGLLDKSATENMMSNQLAKLSQLQNPDGSFSWFAGMNPSRYITQHIAAGFGWLFTIDSNLKNDDQATAIVTKSIGFLKKELNEDLKSWQKDTSTNKSSPVGTLHLLYAMSFHERLDKLADAAPFIDNICKKWPSYQAHAQALIATILERSGHHSEAVKVVESIKENLVRQGKNIAYNKEQGYYWYNNNIETQAVILNAISEVMPEDTDINAIRNWLITQKRTQSWRTTRSTAMAVYAILGSSTTTKPSSDEVKAGKKRETTTAAKPYVSFSWKDGEISKAAGQAHIIKNGDLPSFGAWNYIYFEDNDKVKSHSGGELSITRDLFAVVSSPAGDRLIPAAETTLRKGDRIRVRLTITANNRMDFVHINDQRSAGIEPVRQLSGCSYTPGLIYYVSTHDASTDIFIDSLPKGTFSVEYDLFVVREGVTSNGFAMIESFYAPEMKAHTEGSILKVEK